MAHGWIVGILVGYILFNLGLWRSDSTPKPLDTAWAASMLGGTLLMFISVLLWAVPNFFEGSPVKWLALVTCIALGLAGPVLTASAKPSR